MPGAHQADEGNLSPSESSSPPSSSPERMSDSDDGSRALIRDLIQEGADAREHYSEATRELDHVKTALAEAEAKAASLQSGLDDTEKKAGDVKEALVAVEREVTVARIDAAKAQGVAAGTLCHRDPVSFVSKLASCCFSCRREGGGGGCNPSGVAGSATSSRCPGGGLRRSFSCHAGGNGGDWDGGTPAS